MKFTSKLVSNSFYLFLDWFAVGSIALLFWFFVNKNLNPEQVGIIYTFINTAVLLYNIAIFGSNTSIVKLIPEYLAKKQFKKVSSLIRFYFKFIISILFVVSLTLVLFSNELSSVLKLNNNVFMMMIIATVLLTFCGFFGFIIYGFQNFKKIFKTGLYGNLVKLLTTILFLYLGFSYFGPIVALMLGFLVTLLFRLDRKFFEKGNNSIDKKQIIFSYSLPAFISTFALVILSSGHYVILTVMKDLGTTGKYGVAMTLASQILLIPSILSAALFPIISQLNATKNFKHKQSNLINFVLKYALLIGLPLTSFLILFSKPLILLYSRSEFLPATQLFPIIATASFVFGLGTIYLTSLYAIGKTKIYRNILLLSTSLFLLLSVLLTYFYSSIGLATSYLISVSILSFLCYYFIKKSIKTVFNHLLVVKIIIANLVFILLSYLVDLIPVAFYLKVVLVGTTGIIYLLILMPLRFYTRDDIEIITFFESRSPKNLRKAFSFVKKIISKNV